MMKKLITILFILITVSGYSQQAKKYTTIYLTTDSAIYEYLNFNNVIIGAHYQILPQEKAFCTFYKVNGKYYHE